MKLSRRLQTIADMIPRGKTVVDVGCDHGYLPIYLLKNHWIPGAVAVDVRSGPLERARRNIEAFGLEDYIETRLSDGLEAVAPGEGQVLVIAGMGGPLMEKILERESDTADAFPLWILQPQSDIPHFRRFLEAKGRRIIEERIVFEDGKYYSMMAAEPGNPFYRHGIEYLYGGLLLERRDPVLHQFLLKEKQQITEILVQLESAGTRTAANRKKELEKEKEQLMAALQYYEL